MSAAKQDSGFYYARNFGEPLWQRYGFERVLRPEETTATVVRNILENPLRAGLVDGVDEYPFIGSSAYTVGELMDLIQSQPQQSR